MKVFKYIVLCSIISISILNINSVSGKTVKKSGYYTTVVQSNKPTYDDEYIKKVKVRKNKIITYGSYRFGKIIWGEKRLKCQKRTFKLSKKCIYIDGYGVPGGKHRITKKEAMQKFKGNLYFPNGCPMCCIIRVKKGKVVKLMFGQN